MHRYQKFRLYYYAYAVYTVYKHMSICIHTVWLKTALMFSHIPENNQKISGSRNLKYQKWNFYSQQRASFIIPIMARSGFIRDLCMGV